MKFADADRPPFDRNAEVVADDVEDHIEDGGCHIPCPEHSFSCQVKYKQICFLPGGPTEVYQIVHYPSSNASK